MFEQSLDAPPDAPDEYKHLMAGAKRLSVDIRFRPGRSDLDNKAIADLDRVVRFVSDRHYSGDKLLLLGFADSTGARRISQTLSEDRARKVKQQFQKKGLIPGTVRAFGPDLAIASNETDEGREKNRRVEIWLRQ